jgi:hypothetical protein
MHATIHRYRGSGERSEELARAVLRSAAWRRDTLATPLAERRTLAASMRAQSRAANSNKPDRIMDACPNASVVELTEALKKFLKTSPMMAYLAMMAPRLVELNRVLKPSGSLYLHCDPTASHYLKMLMAASCQGMAGFWKCFQNTHWRAGWKRICFQAVMDFSPHTKLLRTLSIRCSTSTPSG